MTQGWPDTRLQRLAYRASMHMMLGRQRPNRQLLDPVIAANVGELLHLSLPAMPTAAMPLPQADGRVDASRRRSGTEL
jgi:hypothetical protein